jgi:hypothetical protein
MQQHPPRQRLSSNAEATRGLESRLFDPDDFSGCVRDEAAFGLI